MIQIWFAVIVSLFVQEPASSAGIFLYALHKGVNIWAIHLAWLISVIVKILFSFALGMWVHRAAARSRVGRAGKFISTKIESWGGKYGKHFILFLCSLLTFTATSAFVAPWLEISLVSVLGFVTAGTLVLYILEWGVVFGARFVAPGFMTELALVLVIGIGIGFAIRAFRKKSGMMG